MSTKSRQRSSLAAVMSASIWLATAAPIWAVSDAAKAWDQMQRAGTEAFATSRYGDAERLLKQAVIKAASFGESDLRFAKSLGELGRLLTVRGRFAEAEPLLEEEFHVKEMAMGEDNVDLIPDMGSLIRFHLEYGTAKKADPLTLRVIFLVLGMMKEHDQAIGAVRAKKGTPLTAWAGTASLAGRTPLLDWAITCDALGDAYKTQGNFDFADRLYKAGLDVKTAVLGKEHLSLANSYDSLGTLCLEKNDDAEAESYYKDALQISEKILTMDSPKVFYRLDKLGKCLIKEKKYEEAEQLYQRAQNYWKARPGPGGDHCTEARALYALGSLYVEEKKYGAAAGVLHQALHLAEGYHGEYSISLVPYLLRYSDALYYLGQKGVMSQLRSRAHTISGII